LFTSKKAFPLPPDEVRLRRTLYGWRMAVHGSYDHRNARLSMTRTR
jgi:hypothetical protein